MPFGGMNDGGFSGLFDSMPSPRSNNSNNGKITGARQTILSIGNVLGPLIGSAVYVSGSPFIFIVGAIIILISLIMYISYFVIKKKKHYV